MAGRGRAPKPIGQRRNQMLLHRGEWKDTPKPGWQHGDVPAPPKGLLAASVDAWNIWFNAWFAAHWTPEDLPGLRLTISLYDQAERGRRTAYTELRQHMDSYGITPKGQQDRRWSKPKTDEPTQGTANVTEGKAAWSDLRVVDTG